MTTNIDNQVREESAIRQLRNALVKHYQDTAVETFRQYAELNDAEFVEFMRLTNNGTLVYTCSTSEETLKADAESESPRYKKSKKFGTTQWYTKRQEIGTAIALVSAYSGYLSFVDSKAKDSERLAKRLDNTATDFANMTAAEQAEYIARLTAILKK